MMSLREALNFAADHAGQDRRSKAEECCVRLAVEVRDLTEKVNQLRVLQGLVAEYISKPIKMIDERDVPDQPRAEPGDDAQPLKSAGKLKDVTDSPLQTPYPADKAPTLPFKKKLCFTPNPVQALMHARQVGWCTDEFAIITHWTMLAGLRGVPLECVCFGDVLALPPDTLAAYVYAKEHYKL